MGNCNCVTDEETLVCDQDGVLLQDLQGATNDELSNDWQMYIEEPIVGSCSYRGRRITRAELLAGGGAGEVVPWRGYLYMDADMDNGCWLVANGRTITYQNQSTGDTELVQIEDARGRVLVTPNQSNELATGVTANGVKMGFAKSRLRINQMPNHGHNLQDPGHTHGFQRKRKLDADSGHHEATSNAGQPWTGVTTFRVLSATTGITIQNVGGGQAHNNMQPSVGKTLFINSCRAGWDIVNISGIPVLTALNDNNWDENNLNDPNA